MRRRDAIKLLTLPLLASGASACGTGGRGELRVAGVWGGWELTQFRRVLAEYGGQDVTVVSAGNDISRLLENRVADAALPHVAVVPYPQLVQDNRDRLVPLGPSPVANPSWDAVLTFDDQVYGRWFKVAHKSLVWYRPDALAGRPPPERWDEFVELCQRLAGSGPTAPLAIGAADGWVLTDWFENVLIGRDPHAYRELAREAVAGRGMDWRRPAVAEALRRLGRLWRIENVFAGGPRRALQTQFDQSVLDVFQHRQAAMVAGGDFAWPVITQYTDYPTGEITWSRFPWSTTRPVLVGGDAAVVLRPEAPGARELVEWLVRPDAVSVWSRSGGFLTINEGSAAVSYPSQLRAPELVAELRRGLGDGGPVTFDLSDQLRGRLASGDGRGAWKIFQDFFAQVTMAGRGVERAVADAVEALQAASGGPR